VLAPQLVYMSVEALELGEEISLREVAVDDPNRVIRIQGRHQRISGVADCDHVPGCNVTCGADESEAFHVGLSVTASDRSDL
jgi:hypothetical protein